MSFLVNLALGLLFGLGLVVSGMSDPAKVLNFLDLAGNWDPSLAFVMGGAVAVAFVGYRLVFARGRPVVGDTFHLPEWTEIDRRVMELSREHLPALCGDAFDSPHANIVVGDAFAWIAQARDLDAVIYDLTMDPVREGQSRADFISGIVAHMARALRPGGVLSMQCCGHGLRDADDRATRRELLPLIREAVDVHFTDRCEQSVLVPSYRDLWTFLSARKPA